MNLFLKVTASCTQDMTKSVNCGDGKQEFERLQERERRTQSGAEQGNFGHQSEKSKAISFRSQKQAPSSSTDYCFGTAKSGK